MFSITKRTCGKEFFLCRPENSLLAEDLEYDSAVRQAPVFTEEVARKLEDIIRLVFYICRMFSAGMLSVLGCKEYPGTPCGARIYRKAFIILEKYMYFC
jgi:hypothetical protein